PISRSRVVRRAACCSAARSALGAGRRGRRAAADMTGSLNRVAHTAVVFAADFECVTTARRQTEPMSESRTSRLWSAAPLAARRLDQPGRDRFLAHAERLVHRVNWEAARGLTLTDGVVDAIAAHAALLVAGFEPRTEPFRDVTSVIVHAGTIVSR